MRQPASVRSSRTSAATRLSESFFMRDLLYSEIAAIQGFRNLPDDPDLAIAAGTRLATELLEPLQQRFGRFSVRSAYRSPETNGFGNANKLNCAVNEANYAGHIWDRRDAAGRMGATACIVVNRFIPYYERTGNWEALAWWVHDHLHTTRWSSSRATPPSTSAGARSRNGTISSHVPPRRGRLTGPDKPNWAGSHAESYAAILSELP